MKRQRPFSQALKKKLTAIVWVQTLFPISMSCLLPQLSCDYPTPLSNPQLGALQKNAPLTIGEATVIS